MTLEPVTRKKKLSSTGWKRKINKKDAFPTIKPLPVASTKLEGTKISLSIVILPDSGTQKFWVPNTKS